MLKLGSKVLLKSDNHLTWVPMLMDWGIRMTFVVGIKWFVL
jgi:hypothetical protein